MTFVTAIQPTGTGAPHLGNFLGVLSSLPSAIGPEDVCFVADLHATTVRHSPADLHRASLVSAAAMIACGVPTQAVFRQSAVRQHSELFVILAHLARIGDLSRMTQFKSKAGASLLRDDDSQLSIGLGLLTYPVLMAADILLYQPDMVPAGGDQLQHIQLTRTLARAFNRHVKEMVFRAPQPVSLNSPAARVMSLSDPSSKMSKSTQCQNGVVYLDDPMDVVMKKYRSAVTDSAYGLRPYGERQSVAGQNLLNILVAMTGQSEEVLCGRYADRGYRVVKDALIEAHEEHVHPVSRKMSCLLDDQASLAVGLQDAARKAACRAEITMQAVRRHCGLST
ncbi:hypothetical protein AD929_12690 [Gluconobacter potus]|uniref:Tryptophan--tRNA ligase n=1 Tax=Gluconobacter potus TaxID=2724927 RepID=A0A149QS16_9PROT|nr:tryptophan--tRNA ligase [Gluconobacter potus]KXV00080.1 hypothetical protein AD929_12690 [Gluconobacter potus]